MNTSIGELSDTQLREAIALAVRAPSIHNTQPWRWRLRADGLELLADPTRQLSGTDPDGHALVVSCGGALQLARLGLATQGWSTTVERLPDSSDPDLLARIRVTGRVNVDEDVLARAAAARRRVIERRPFDPRPVPEELLEGLGAVAENDGTFLHIVRREEELLGLTVFTSYATRLETGDEPVRADLAAWTRTEDAEDGVPARVVPRGGAHRRSDLELRDFGLAVEGGEDISAAGDEHPVVLTLFTDADDVASWLQAGEALARVLVNAEQAGLAVVPFTQPVDWPWARTRLRQLMGWTAHPQFLFRVGWPPAGERSAPVGRRTPDEVVEESPRSSTHVAAHCHK